MNKIAKIFLLIAVTLAMAGITAAAPNSKNSITPPEVSVLSSAIINNSLIQLGVNDEGDLNVGGGTPSNETGITMVGLRYMPTNNEATADGCPCEGWGAADNITNVFGKADRAQGGATGMTLVNFTSDASTATSIVNISTILQVKHFYHPSVSPNLYQADVSITNIGSVPVELLYKRVMDWDIEPTAFDEYVTLNKGSSANLIFTSDDGFADANPLAAPSQILFNGSAVDSGPDDHGALFLFNFGMLAPGATKEFRIFYGAGANQAEANAALAAVGAEAFSFGKPSSPGGKDLGVPNTFIFAFAGVGGTPIIGGVKVPTLNPIGITALAGLLAIIAFVTLRRRL